MRKPVSSDFLEPVRSLCRYSLLRPLEGLYIQPITSGIKQAYPSLTNGQQITQGKSIAAIGPVDSQAIAAAFRIQSDNVASLLQQPDDGSNKIISQTVPMIVFAIANADREVDQKEIAAFLELFRFQTAAQIFTSELILAFFKYNDGRQQFEDVSALKYYEYTRHHKDVYVELESHFSNLAQLTNMEERKRLRDDVLNLCFLIANSSGSVFEFESNISDEEKYAASKIRAIVDKNFDYPSSSEAISPPVYLADTVEKFALLFQSQFKVDASIVEISAFVMSVFEYSLTKIANKADHTQSLQSILSELSKRYGLDENQVVGTLQIRAPAYVEMLIASFRSIQSNENSGDMNQSMMFAMLFYKNATALNDFDIFTCLTILAPEMHSFAMETAAFVSDSNSQS
jgi:hypothetical protein